MGMKDVKPLLGIPDDLDVLAIIPFGYPARPVGKGQKIASHSPRWPTSSGSDSLFNDPTGKLLVPVRILEHGANVSVCSMPRVTPGEREITDKSLIAS